MKSGELDSDQCESDVVSPRKQTSSVISPENNLECDISQEHGNDQILGKRKRRPSWLYREGQTKLRRNRGDKSDDHELDHHTDAGIF